MADDILTLDQIKAVVSPLAMKYQIEAVYLFGSYARKEASKDSDLDFLVFGGEHFKLTMVFSFAEELREIFQRDVDVFEINELNTDSEFHRNVMREKVLVA